VFFLPLGQFETHSFLFSCLCSLVSLSHSQRLNEKFDEKINAGIDQLINEVPEPPPNAPLPPSGA
jgi:hypothetical protein